jgi:hypothetical protein
VDNLDLAMAEKELKKFRTVDYLANYTVFNLTPPSVGSDPPSWKDLNASLPKLSIA